MRVTGGIHEGVVVAPDAESCVLGSSREADLVLLDEGIAPVHVRLRFYGRTVAVDAVGGTVAICGRSSLEQGHGCRLPLPAEIGIGAARLEIGASGPSGTKLRRLSLACATLIVLILAPMVAFGTHPRPTAHAETSPVDLTLQTGSIAPSVETGAGVASLLRPASLAIDPVSDLRQRAATSGLSSLVFERQGSHIAATGALTDDQRVVWSQIQQWFDGRYGDRFLLTNQASAAARREPPRITFRAVWFGDQPYVIARNGDRLYPGAALGEGWSLKSIEENRILVTRNGEDVALTL